MPLVHSASKKAVSENIKTEMSRKPQRQAIAIALETARRASKGKEVGGQVNFADGGALPSMPWYAKSESRSMAPHVGPLLGSTPGRADKVNTSVANGSHILPSDTVSALGSGNSLAGHAVLSKMFPGSSGPLGMKSPLHASKPNFPKLPSIKPPKTFKDGGKTEHIPVALSDGEFCVDISDVKKIGNGNEAHGHAILDHFILKIRKDAIKKLKSLPGPSKS